MLPFLLQIIKTLIALLSKQSSVAAIVFFNNINVYDEYI